MLVVVGREDTGGLEAQVRGSRYAWDMRLISVERLIKLVQIKEKSDDPTTLTQIRQLLQPFEYTKIDRIIDVIFTTAADVGDQIVEHARVEDPDETRGAFRQDRTDPDLLSTKRLEAVEAFARSKGQELVRYSRTLFWSSDKTFRVCCAVSKRYEGDYQPYWYAFHPNWDRFLSEGSRVPFFFKQWGGVRKTRNGRELDGRTYDEYPRRVATPVPDRLSCMSFAQSILNSFRGSSLVQVTA